MPITRTLTPEEENELIVKFRNGDADSIRAYRKLRAAYRPKINLMADMYRKRGDNISQPQMVSVAEQMFPHWMHNYEPGQSQFNTYIENQMDWVFKNEKSDSSVGYSYTPREKTKLISGYTAARSEAQLNFGPNPTNQQILRFWKMHNPEVTMNQLEHAAKYVRMQRSGDTMVGEDDEEGLRFDDQFRMQEIKLYDSPQNYVQMVGEERMTSFLARNFQGNERKALEAYYIHKKPIAHSVILANMDTDTFKRLRARAKELAKKENFELPK